MGGEVDEEQVAVWTIGTTSLTVNINVKWWNSGTSSWDSKASGTMTEEGSSGRYYYHFTPDAAGYWKADMDYTVDSTKHEFSLLYFIGRGQEKDIEDKVDTVDGLVDTLITRLTAARAGYLDELAAANIPADVDILKTYCDKIDDAVNGLTAIKAEVEGLAGAAMRGTDNAALASVCTEVRLAELAAANLPEDIDTLLTRVTAAVALASVCTEARLSKLDAAISSRAPSGEYDTQLSTTERASAAKLEDAMQKATAPAYNQDTDSLEAIREAVDAIPTTAERGTDNALLAASYVTERGTDNAATEAKQDVIDGIVDDIKARVQYHVIREPFPSDPEDLITLTQASSDDALPDVVLPNISGTIDRAYLWVIISAIGNTHASPNALNGASLKIKIKKSTGTWGVDDIDAINLADNAFYTLGKGSETERVRGGVPLMGKIDVSSEVDVFNATYNLRFEDNVIDNDNLKLYDVQAFLVVVYH